MMGLTGGTRMGAGRRRRAPRGRVAPSGVIPTAEYRGAPGPGGRLWGKRCLLTMPCYFIVSLTELFQPGIRSGGLKTPPPKFFEGGRGIGEVEIELSGKGSCGGG